MKKKGKKGGTKKKDDKADDNTASEEKADGEQEEAVDTKDDLAKPEAVDSTEPAPEAESSKPKVDGDNDEKAETESPKVEHQPSLTLQSRQRSESFRKQSGVVSPGLKAPTLPPLDSESEVQEVYRKQATRIEELERENKSLKETQMEDAAKRSKTEEELEKLREDSGQMAELRSKASTADDRVKEVEKLVCAYTSPVHECLVLTRARTTSWHLCSAN